MPGTAGPMQLATGQWVKKRQLVQFSVQGNAPVNFQTQVHTIQQVVDEHQVITVYCSINEQANPRDVRPGRGRYLKKHS
jgi:hypothetical protein